MDYAIGALINKDRSSSPDPASTRRRLEGLKNLGYVEGGTLVLLVFVAVPLKYFFHNPLLVKILGPIHGLAFVIYVVWLVETALRLRWRIFDVVKLFIWSFLPFGYIPAARFIRRKESQLPTA